MHRVASRHGAGPGPGQEQEIGGKRSGPGRPRGVAVATTGRSRGGGPKLRRRQPRTGRKRQERVKPLLRSGGKTLIGVVHLLPLPGAPRWRGQLDAVIKLAVADAKAYQSGGADAVCIENFCDVPFSKGAAGPETVAAMAAAGYAVGAAVTLPIGFNVLRNDPRPALALG